MKLKTFEQLALPQLDIVYRLAMVLVNDIHVATDLVQDTFRQCHLAADLIAVNGSGFRLWLLKILREEYSDRVEKSNYRFGTHARTDDHAIAVPDVANESERVKFFIRMLPAHLRSVLMLWSVENLDYDSIAFVEDVPQETVQRWLYEARCELGRLLLREEARQSEETSHQHLIRSSSQLTEAMAL